MASADVSKAVDGRDPAADEAAWIAAARGGDESAFSRLVRRHQRRVFRLVGRFYLRPEDAEDAAQETFLRAWTKLDRYRGDAPFEHWLTRLCLNLCFQRLRRRRIDAAGVDGPDLETLSPGDLEHCADPTAALEARRLLAALPPADRFILLLLDGEGWSVAEIAERLGWTRVNVKVRAHRARKRLRQRVAADVDASLDRRP